MMSNITYSSFVESIKLTNNLKEQSVNLRQIQEASSSEDFANLLADFEVEVDKLNQLLINQFDEDPTVMQIAFELKAAVIALKANNVEMNQKLVETEFKHCSPNFGDYDSSRFDDNCL